MKKCEVIPNERELWRKANAVSRRFLTSNVPDDVHVEAGIDKIMLSAPAGLDIQAVFRCASEADQSVKTKRLKEGYFLLIGRGRGTVHCKYTNFPPFPVKKIFFNPNYYSCFEEYEQHLVLIFGLDVMTWKLERVDFCLDFYVPYKDLMVCLDVKRKYKVSTFLDHQKTTGVHIGGGNDKFSIYCKTTENKNRRNKNPKFENVDVSRIERQMSGKKVPAKNLKDLKENYRLVIQQNIFGQLELFRFVLRKKFLTRFSALKRKNELAVLTKYDGFFAAKKHLNGNKNFDRDYGDLFRKDPFPADYKKIFAKFIRKHFLTNMKKPSLGGVKI